jgi:hypothetical protein
MMLISEPRLKYCLVLVGVGAPDSFKLFDLGLVPFLARLGEVQVELRVDVGGPTGDLAGADVGGEQFGAQLNHMDRDQGSP